jgi:hypothetical protein
MSRKVTAFAVVVALGVTFRKQLLRAFTRATGTWVGTDR